MDGAFDWVAAAFPMGRAVPAIIMIVIFSFLAAGWRTILIFTVIAILIDPLLPAIGGLLSIGAPSDFGSWLADSYVNDDIGLWGLRAVLYLFTIGVVTFARRDMMRHYEPSKTPSAPIIH